MTENKYLIIAALVSLYLFMTACTDTTINPPDDNSKPTHILFINEFMAKNDTGIKNSAGKYADWIEIYNPQDTAVNIGGFYISDNPDNLFKFQFSNDSQNLTTIQSKSFLIIFADDTVELGPLHVNFKLDAEGEYIYLSKLEGSALRLIDSVAFGVQQGDISYCRFPDGSDNWEFFSKPTPGTSNTK